MARLLAHPHPVFHLGTATGHPRRQQRFDLARFTTAMKRPIRAVVYGFLIWWLWFGFVGISQLFPESFTSLPAFALLRLLVLVVLVVAFAVDYLRRVERSGVGEGLAVGVLWMALMIANDFGHFLFMAASFDLGMYLAVSAPLYAFIPLITVTMFGRLVSAEAGRLSDER
jgi:hypothetical protein